jgi:multidrug efflux pump subunit AcrA (membrane-fusion protein)
VSAKSFRKRGIVTGAAVVCAAVLALAFFHLRDARYAGAASPFATYAVESVLQSNTVQVTGNIELVGEEDMGFLSSGEVAAVYMQEGDHVEAGDLIAELDDSEQIYDLASSILI